MIEIFTDASVNKATAIATCFCMNDSTFIGHKIFENKDIHNSQLGELFGAVKAIEYAYHQFDLTGDSVVLYTDSQQLIDSLTYDVSKYDDEACETINNYYLQRYREYVKMFNIDVQKIQGHQRQHNPNKVVDLISVHVLRNSV